MNPQQHKPNGGLLVMDREARAVGFDGDGIETLLTAREVAAILKVSTGWVRDHAGRKQPHLKCVHVGDLLRFRPSDVKEFIEQWCK